MKIVAINDLGDIENLAYLLEFDTTYGRLKYNVTVQGDSLNVNGNEIKCFKEPKTNNLPWKELGIDIVIESTGVYTTAEKSQAHLDAGAKKVIITAPADEDTKIIVYGVNEEIITKLSLLVHALQML